MDLLTISIGVGLVVGLVFVSLFGLSAGGMVVPGYMALAMDHPWSVVLTFADAILIWLIVKFISKYLIIYGRRRIALTVLLAFIFGILLNSFFQSPQIATNFSEEITVVGYIISGLIALSIDRQGLVETLGTLFIASVLIRLVLICVLGAGIEI